MTRHETNCEKQQQEIKELAAKRDATCKEMADLQGRQVYKTKLAELVEVLDQIAL